MTDGDALIGTATNLLALGIVAGVAGKVLSGTEKKCNCFNSKAKRKSKPISW